MPFTIPPFDVFCVNTRNLENLLSTSLGRYKVGEPNAGETQLQLLIKRVQTIIGQSNSSRIKEKQSLTKLANDFQSVRDEKRSNLALMILLGGLFHRYCRLKIKYIGFGFGLAATSPMNCELFKDIRKTLGLQLDARDYQAADAARLDETTLFTCLEEFQNYMLGEEDHIKRFKTFEHLKEDPNFEEHLKDLIIKYKALALPILRQYKAIHFLNSLSEQIQQDTKKIEEALDVWSKALASKFKNFQNVTLSELEDHLLHFTGIESTTIKETILNLLSVPATQKILDAKNLDHVQFISNLKIFKQITSSHTLIGGYVLILKSPNIHKSLKMRLHEALGIEQDPKLLTDNQALHSVNFLLQYLQLPRILNYDFFNDKDGMMKQLLNLQETLTDKKVKQTEMANTAAAPAPI